PTSAAARRARGSRARRRLAPRPPGAGHRAARPGPREPAHRRRLPTDPLRAARLEPLALKSPPSRGAGPCGIAWPRTTEGRRPLLAQSDGERLHTARLLRLVREEALHRSPLLKPAQSRVAVEGPA